MSDVATNDAATERTRVTEVYLIGVAAAISIGKVIPFLTQLAESFSISVEAAAFSVSAVALIGIFFAPLGGSFVDRFGSRGAAVAGLLVVAFASIGCSYSGSWTVFLVTRCVEGLGFFLVTLSCGAYITRQSARFRLPYALPLWSTYFPLGIALGELLASHLPGGFRAAFVWHGAMAAALALPAWYLFPAPQAHSPAPLRPLAIYGQGLPLRISVAFGCTTMLQLGLLSVVPWYLERRLAFSADHAAIFGSLAALSSVVGRLLVGALLKMHINRGQIAKTALSLSLLSVVVAFSVDWAGSVAVCVAILSFNISIGFMPGLLSSLMPLVIESPAQAGSMNGLFAQFGNVGNLLAAPVFVILQSSGSRWSMAALTLVLVLCIYFLTPRLQIHAA